MSLNSKYSNTASRIIVALLLLVMSSGFTAVHHACLMEQKQCCDAMPAGGPMGGAMPFQGPSVSNADSPCCKSEISGGLTGFTALFEKSNKAESQKFTVSPPHIDFAAWVALPNAGVRFLPQSAQAGSPPSVEKYVLFSSLLI